MKVHLFQGFAADHRLSMDIYAQRVFAELRSQSLSAEMYKPISSLERFATSRLLMRYLRYVRYPQLARNYCRHKVSHDAVRHILDHGYAHLLPAVSVSQKHGGTLAPACARTVVTVHDLIPLLAWRGRFGAQHIGRKPTLALYSAQFLSTASKLIAVSANTANDLTTELGIPAKRIEVVHSPLDANFVRSSKADIEVFRRRLGMSNNYFWILVSGNEFYKNHEVVVATFKLLRQRGLPVKILKTGIFSGAKPSVFDALHHDEVLRVAVASHELATLYSAVDCLFFPSIYEGFGYPVIEALACGTPVVCANTASLPEVGGTLAWYAAPDDTMGMADALEQIIAGQGANDLRTAGPAWVQQFRAPQVASQLLEQYQSLVAL